MAALQGLRRMHPGQLAKVKCGCESLSEAPAVTGSLLWLAPPCATWVWMSRGSTGRSRTRARGSRRRSKVIEANRFVRRLLYLLAYAVKKHIFFCIEQPCSSLMALYHPLKRFLDQNKALFLSVSLGFWGAPTEKLAQQYRSHLLCVHVSVYVYTCTHACMGPRKNVTLYTNAAWLLPLGKKLDPLERSVLKINIDIYELEIH